MFDRTTSFRFANNYESDYLNGKQMRRKTADERNRHSYRFRSHHKTLDHNIKSLCRRVSAFDRPSHQSHNRHNRLTIAPNRGLFANGLVSNVINRSFNDINTDMEARINEDLDHILNKNKPTDDSSSRRQHTNHRKRKHLNVCNADNKYCDDFDSDRNDYVEQYLHYQKYGDYKNNYKQNDESLNNAEHNRVLSEKCVKKTKDINNRYVYKRKRAKKSNRSNRKKSSDYERNQSLICDEKIDDNIVDDNVCNKSVQNSLRSEDKSSSKSLPKITNNFVFDFKRVNSNRRVEKKCVNTNTTTNIPSSLGIIQNLMTSYGLERKEFAKRVPQFKANVMTDICDKLRQTAITNGFEMTRNSILINNDNKQKKLDEKRVQTSVSVDRSDYSNSNKVETNAVNVHSIQCMVSKVIKHVSEALDSLSNQCMDTSFFANNENKTNSNIIVNK